MAMRKLEVEDTAIINVAIQQAKALSGTPRPPADRPATALRAGADSPDSFRVETRHRAVSA